MSSGVHLFWITSRAAGISALLLASVSVSVGLTMSLRRGARGPDLRVAHEALSLATIAAIGLHGLALLADPWLNPGVAGVLVPFQIGYRPAAVAAGILAAYGLVALGLGYYARSRIGPARWRRLHRWTALFWLLAVVHGFTAGSDATAPWFIVSVALVAAPGAVLLARRLGGAPRGASESPAVRNSLSF